MINLVANTLDRSSLADTFINDPFDDTFPHTTHLHAMSTSSVVDVVDGTDLTTLVGQGAEKDEYKKLVEKLFGSELGNLKWRDVKKYTRADFVKKYGKGNAEDKLESWINHYNLKFQPGEGGELLFPYSCIRFGLFVYC